MNSFWFHIEHFWFQVEPFGVQCRTLSTEGSIWNQREFSYGESRRTPLEPFYLSVDFFLSLCCQILAHSCGTGQKGSSLCAGQQDGYCRHAGYEGAQWPGKDLHSHAQF